MLNAEIRGGMACCCDISDQEVMCVSDINDLEPSACIVECQPYFRLRFQACPSNETCFFAEDITVPYFSSTFDTSLILIQSPFNQSELETFNQVRTCNCTIIKTTQIFKSYVHVVYSVIA